MLSSLDGFRAKPDEDVSWMISNDHYPTGLRLTDEENSDFLVRIKCYIVGSHTY